MEVYLNKSLNLLVHTSSCVTENLLEDNGFKPYLTVWGKNVGIRHRVYHQYDGKSFKPQLLEIDTVNKASLEDLPLISLNLTSEYAKQLADNRLKNDS